MAGVCWAILLALLAQHAHGDWTTWGAGSSAGRYTTNTCINSGNAKLTKKWAFTVNAPVSATPTVCGGKVFFPDDAGNVYALDAKTGNKIWQKSMNEYMPEEGGNTYARNSPATDKDCKIIVIGTKPRNNPGKTGAWVLGLDTATGRRVWRTRVSSHPYAQVTQSATVYGKAVYVGTASSEENQSGGATCCVFRGRFLKLDLYTGAIKWSQWMTIDNKMDKNSWSGCAIWGSSPAIDPVKKIAVVTTGNNYKFPKSHQDCLRRANGDAKKEAACNPAANFVDSFVAMNLDTGKVVWSTSVSWDYYAWWNGQPFCQGFGCWITGPDRDFAQGAVFAGGKFISGQKSGSIYAINSADGSQAWKYKIKGGSLQFGSASDGKLFYFGSTGGFVGALDVATGQLKWSANVGSVYGPVSVANDVVFAPISDQKKVVWLNAKTGAKLGEYYTNKAQFSGPSIDGNMVWFGSGYIKFERVGQFPVTALQASC